MDPESRNSGPRSSTPDDDQLARLVRASTDTWRLPPQRLDQPTWRDRVERRSERRRGGWLARLAGPATAAVVATVIVAFLAVWLTTPRANRAIVGASSSPSGAAPSIPSSPRPTVTSLPSLFRTGDLPQPAQLIVRSGDAYRIADLTNGTVGAKVIGSHSGPTTVLARPGGGWLCVCADWTGSSFGPPSGLNVSLETVDAAGTPGPRSTITSLRGTADPGSSPVSSAQPNAPQTELELVDIAASGSSDGRYAFVSWSARQGGAGWKSGIDVVDLASATVVSSTPLAVAEPAGAGGRLSTRIAPRIALAPSGNRILVSSFWFVEDASAATPPSGMDHWTAPFARNAIGPMTPAGSTASSSCGEVDSGLIDATTYWVVCSASSGGLAIERRTLDGTTIDRTAVSSTSSPLDGGALLARLGDRLYLWDPIAAHLTRFDLATGKVASATGIADASETSPLDAVAMLGQQIGRWMAPPAMAKSILEPALVVSADGSRVYALGIGAPNASGDSGSTGVYAFDATSLAAIGHWTPTADFFSLALAPDGGSLYASGQAGVDAGGHSSVDEASITVYDTADGSVRLIAGRLGSDSLFFPGPIAR
jgi:hypothetical protein